MPWRLFRIALLLLALFPMAPARAEGPGRAAVAWTLWDNQPDFRVEPALFEQLWSAVGGPRAPFFRTALAAPLEERSETATSGTSFERRVRDALTAIERSETPELSIFLGTHGLHGLMSRPNGETVPHALLVDVILRQVDAFQARTGRTVTLTLLYGACRGNSIRASLRERIARAPAGSEYRVNLLASSAASSDTWVGPYLRTMASLLLTYRAAREHLPASALDTLGPEAFRSVLNRFAGDFMTWSNYDRGRGRLPPAAVAALALGTTWGHELRDALEELRGRQEELRELLVGMRRGRRAEAASFLEALAFPERESSRAVFRQAALDRNERNAYVAIRFLGKRGDYAGVALAFGGATVPYRRNVAVEVLLEAPHRTPGVTEVLGRWLIDHPAPSLLRANVAARLVAEAPHDAMAAGYLGADGRLANELFRLGAGETLFSGLTTLLRDERISAWRSRTDAWRVLLQLGDEPGFGGRVGDFIAQLNRERPEVISRWLEHTVTGTSVDALVRDELRNETIEPLLRLAEGVPISGGLMRFLSELAASRVEVGERRRIEAFLRVAQCLGPFGGF